MKQVNALKKLAKSRVSGSVLVVFAPAIMLFGIYRGEMAVVLAKATKICMECIGIG